MNVAADDVARRQSARKRWRQSWRRTTSISTSDRPAPEPEAHPRGVGASPTILNPTSAPSATPSRAPRVPAFRMRCRQPYRRAAGHAADQPDVVSQRDTLAVFTGLDHDLGSRPARFNAALMDWIGPTTMTPPSARREPARRSGDHGTAPGPCRRRRSRLPASRRERDENPSVVPRLPRQSAACPARREVFALDVHDGDVVLAAGVVGRVDERASHGSRIAGVLRDDRAMNRRRVHEIAQAVAAQQQRRVRARTESRATSTKPGSSGACGSEPTSRYTSLRRGCRIASSSEISPASSRSPTGE